MSPNPIQLYSRLYLTYFCKYEAKCVSPVVRKRGKRVRKRGWLPLLLSRVRVTSRKTASGISLEVCSHHRHLTPARPVTKPASLWREGGRERKEKGEREG